MKQVTLYSCKENGAFVNNQSKAYYDEETKLSITEKY